jgi:hypothetical protein
MILTQSAISKLKNKQLQMTKPQSKVVEVHLHIEYK